MRLLSRGMPKIPTRKAARVPPEGWADIEPTVTELEAKLRDAENESSDGKRKAEACWKIFQIHHQKSAYVFGCLKKGLIGKELYDWCVEAGIVDALLVAKWKKPGYERLCCLRCIEAKDTNFQTNCICRVPRSALDQDKIIQCVHCGCRGCSGN